MDRPQNEMPPASGQAGEGAEAENSVSTCNSTQDFSFRNLDLRSVRVGDDKPRTVDFAAVSAGLRAHAEDIAAALRKHRPR